MRQDPDRIGSPPLAVCVGIAVLDQVYRVATLPRGPGKSFAEAYREVGGGPAANAAVTIARLGGRAALWARIGADAVGGRIVSELDAEGIDVSDVRRIDGATSGVSAVVVDQDGERMIINHADPALDRDSGWLPLDRLDGAGVVLGDLRWPEGTVRTLAAARERHLPAVLDADMVPEGTDADAAYANATHVLFSQAALARFADTRDPEAGLRRAARRFGGWTGVSAGADGVFWLEGGGLRHQPAFAVRAVDTLGAGDVLHGAFALALARGAGEAEALRFAAAAAALKCTRFGGRDGIPCAAELTRFLKEAAQ